jgi:TIR domain
MSSNGESNPPAVVDAFLSHSYAAPDVNLFFYELISTVSELAFRVDRGKFRTSTTRLERMIRDTDAFIGVWPLPGDPRRSWDRESLAAESTYYRLELDMAIRARKPGITFCDRRYGNVLNGPPGMPAFRYDAQEVRLSTRSPSWASLQAQVASAWREVRPRLDARVLTRGVEYGRVGVLFPPYGDVDAGGVAAEALSTRALDPVQLRWPPRVGPALLAELRRCDWVIVDASDPAAEGAAAFLHGQFIPVLRVSREPTNAPSPVEEVLFGALEVGYRKDVTRWHTEGELSDGLGERLDVIGMEPDLVGDREAAVRYFGSAAKRKETVFLSYSGRDADLGAQFASELRRRFREVFDYRDRDSLEPGAHWPDQIEAKLAATAVGVILFSRHYKASGHCMEEARRLRESSLSGHAELLPVKLDDEPAPDLLKTLQYDRISQWTPTEIVERLVRRLDATSAR